MQSRCNEYFLSLPEPEQSCLLYMRQFLLESSPQITETWKFNTPFYYYKGHWFCYLIYQPKNKKIYLSFVQGYRLNHPKLVSEGRKQMKVYYVKADQDIALKELKQIMRSAMALY